MKFFKVLSTILLFFGIAMNLCGEAKIPTQSKKEPLKFNHYLTSIIEALPEIKANGMNLLFQANAIQSAKSLSDLSLKGGAKYSNNNQYAMMPSLISGKTESYDAYAALNKKLTSTGTELSLGIDYTKTQYQYHSIPGFSTYNPSVSLTLKQPLLYNFFGKIDRYAEKNEEMKLDIEKVKLLENNKSALNAYKKLYFQYLFYQNSVKNLEEAIKNSKSLRDQVARNLKFNLAEDDDYQGTVASVLNYEQQLQDYQTILKHIEKQMAVYIETEKVTPDENEFEKYLDISLKTRYENFPFEKTNFSKIMDLSFKRLLYAKGVYENKTLPELYLVTGVAQKNLSTKSASAFDLPDTDYFIGFEFTYRFGNNEAKSNLENINLQIQSLKYEYAVTLNAYKKNLAKILEYSGGLKNSLEKKVLYLKSLNQKLAAETRKYRQGRLKLSYIIDTENAIANAKTEIVSLKYQLISYYIDYLDMIQ